MADVNINLFKKIEENVTETEGFPDGYLLVSVNGKVQGVNPDDIGGSGGGLVEITRDDLTGAISNSELVSGATYKITGVHKAHTVNGMLVPALYDDGRGLGTTIFLKAVSENKLESYGSGIFYNPNYDLNTQGYGIWSANNTYAANDVVFWGGYAWKNLNGNVGSQVDILNLDSEWEKLDYTDSNYNEVVDYIEYDINNDFITRRRNEEYNIDVNVVVGIYLLFNIQYSFQYSSISVMNYGLGLNLLAFSGINGVKVNNSYAELVNFKGYLFINVNFDNGSNFSNVNFDNGSNLSNVNFDNNSYLRNVNFDNDSYLRNVNFDNDSYLRNVNFDNNSRLENVNFDAFNIQYPNPTILLNNKNIYNADFKGVAIGIPLPDLSSATVIFDSAKRKEVIQIQGATNNCKLITYDTSGNRVVNDIDD